MLRTRGPTFLAHGARCESLEDVAAEESADVVRQLDLTDVPCLVSLDGIAALTELGGVCIFHAPRLRSLAALRGASRLTVLMGERAPQIERLALSDPSPLEIVELGDCAAFANIEALARCPNRRTVTIERCQLLPEALHGRWQGDAELSRF